MDDNVIAFPKSKIVSQKTSIDEETVKQNLEDVKQTHIQETIAVIAPMLFQQLAIAGFDLMDDEDIGSIKDGAFIVEALRSILFKYYDLDHPFQKISENVFEVKENGLLSIKDTLELVLKIDEERI